MFEFWHQERVTLLLPTGVTDGETQYMTVTADAVMLWSEETHPALPPRTDAHAELLLRSPRPPVAGARIRWHGKEWELGRVRTCQDLDGQRFIYRCTLI